MIESWRTIEGFAPYEVSDRGRVRRGARSLKLVPRKGYLRVCLCLQNHRHFREVHGLVAHAFLGPKPEGMQTAHKDGNSFNNDLGNLAYKSRRENEADKVVHGTHQFGSRNSNAKLSESEVAEIRRALASGERQNTIAAKFGVSPNAICKIAKGRSWQKPQDRQPGPQGDAKNPSDQSS